LPKGNKSMYLALDIGNSRIKYGLFEGEDLKAHGDWQGLSPEELAEQAYNLSPRAIIYSNVRHGFVPEWSDLPKGLSLLALEKDTPLPIENRYRTPQTLGSDRLAAVVGAWSVFGGENCLVVDAGSCITLDLLLDGGFEGGVISPGLNMRLKAMHHFTDGLPALSQTDIGREDFETFKLGKSTKEALFLGALQGAVLEIDAFIEEAEAVYGPLKVAFTGGDAAFLADKMKRKIFVLPHLVLRGLNEILRYHV